MKSKHSKNHMPPAPWRTPQVALAIAQIAIGNAESMIEAGTEAERTQFVQDAFQKTDIVFLLFRISPTEYSYVCAQGSQILSMEMSKIEMDCRTVSALLTPDFETVLQLIKDYGDEEAKRCLSNFTLKSVSPRMRFRQAECNAIASASPILKRYRHVMGREGDYRA